LLSRPSLSIFLLLLLFAPVAFAFAAFPFFLFRAFARPVYTCRPFICFAPPGPPAPLCVDQNRSRARVFPAAAFCILPKFSNVTFLLDASINT
jgi:hypothetical protein